MEKDKKIKLIIGLFYFFFVGLFLYFIFSKFTLDEITSYEFIRNNREYFNNLRETNFLLLSLLFLLFTFVWVLAAGFGSPIAILSGFIFGKWLGTIIVILGLSIGATLLYTFANFFLKELIKEKFLKKYESLEIKFKKSEFIYLLAYRFIAGIPFAISNVLPCIFNVKISNFFWATLIGLAPSAFLICSIGSGLEKMIEQSLEAPSILEMLSSSAIYIPLIIFICLVLFTIFLRKIFYRK